MEKRTPHQNGKMQGGIPIWAKVMAAIAIAAGLALYSLGAATDLIGIGQKDMQVQVEISSGSTSMQIATQLKEADIIDHPMLFLAVGFLKGDMAELKAGEYLFNSNMSYGDILSVMKKGADRTDVVNITFYEGMTQREIANLLEKEGVCSAEDFHQYLSSTDFTYEFCRMIPDDGRFRPMEGYLFPDTYQFFKGENVASVAKKFLDTFNARFTDEMYEQMRAAGMTFDDVITLASVIQEECSNPEEMAAVSGVFHNRLDNFSEFPKLQSDVTIFYVNKDIIPFMKQNDQELYDKYNTYKCDGLPLGPISNPGQEAIKAAINPKSHKFYYFISDKDGNFIYAQTLAEHNRNIRNAGI